MLDAESSDGYPYIVLLAEQKFSTCDKIEITDGDLLSSKGQMLNQKSCLPSVINVGNYYSFTAANSGGGILNGINVNSICPKNWKITSDIIGTDKSFHNLYEEVYNYTNEHSLIIRSPLHSAPAGILDGANCSVWGRGSNGRYWTSESINNSSAKYIDFSGSAISFDQGGFFRHYGYSLRCGGWRRNYCFLCWSVV